MLERADSTVRTLKVVGFSMLLVLTVVLPAASGAQAPDEELVAEESLATSGATVPPSIEEAYSRDDYAWPFVSGPFYGRVVPPQRRERGVLHTAVGSFRLGQGQLELPPGLKRGIELQTRAYQYLILQFDPDRTDGGSLRDVLGVIEGHGGAVVHVMPVTAVVARLDLRAYEAIRGAPGLIAVEPYHPAFKLHPSIGRMPLLDPERALSEVYDLEIRLFAGEDAPSAARRIEALGGTVSGVWPTLIRAELHRSKLTNLASLEPVRVVYEHLQVVQHGEETTTTIQTGAWNRGVTPYNDAGVVGVAMVCDDTGDFCATDDDCAGSCVAGTQILMIVDSGMQRDAGDLSHSAVVPGNPGPNHRKVLFYGRTNVFGGGGDLEDCYVLPGHSFSHGHMVAATALGNGSTVELDYGVPWTLQDQNGAAWKVDGVAPRARLVIYDAMVTPPDGDCNGLGLSIGTLYAAGAGSMAQAYDDHRARIFNFSWGRSVNEYMGKTVEVDEFLDDHRDAMVFISAGNSGRPDPSGVPEPGSLGYLATTKNGVAMGASVGPDDTGDDPLRVKHRAYFSAVGPAADTNRIAPLLMAPGIDEGTMGLKSEFCCRSDDNDHDPPVLCNPVSGKSGTSFSAPAAAGAALLVRDYFSQGFYPDGTIGDPGNEVDRVRNVSGALVKAVLVTSADFLGRNFSGQGGGGLDNLTIRHRFNREQGYGRIRLDNALPLESWPAGPTGLIVVDGAVNDIGGSLTGVIDATIGEEQEGTIEICDPSQELRVALTWVEPGADGFQINDLDLELESPSGVVYYGNYFTDDDNRNEQIDLITEDCPGFDGALGALDASAWSLPICVRADATLPPHDSANLVEAVFLSPDPDGNGNLLDGLCSAGSTNPLGMDGLGGCGYYHHCAWDPLNPDPNDFCDGATQQVEPGDWTVRVIAGNAGVEAEQRFALAIAGGVCLGSAVRLDRATYGSNDALQVRVLEKEDVLDPGLSAEEIELRVTIEVLDESGTVVDRETGLTFHDPEPGSLAFRSVKIFLHESGDPLSFNGLLEVQDGYTVRAVYADETNGAEDPDKRRTSQAEIRGSMPVGVIGGSWELGSATGAEITGGCEWEEDGERTPDGYMDAGESIAYTVGFRNAGDGIGSVEAGLACVRVDDDSPAGCAPDGTGCDPGECGGFCDPQRQNNPPCGDLLQIIDPHRDVDWVPAGETVSLSFAVKLEDPIAGTPEIEMLLSVTAPAAGMTEPLMLAFRHTLNVGTSSLYYSTDFPDGGSEILDHQNNELVDGLPTHDGFLGEYREWSSLKLGRDPLGDLIAVNANVQAPWSFDTNNGGFVTGGGFILDDEPEVLAQWGEDTNFNNILDGACSADPTIACYALPIDLRCPPDPAPGHPDCEPNDACCVSFEDRDPPNGQLDQNWSINGGCGWQTKEPGSCTLVPLLECYEDDDCDAAAAGTCVGVADTGGVWHTGRIGTLDAGDCLVVGDAPGQCQAYETLPGDTGTRTWFELLMTPELEKVNRQEDAGGNPLYAVQVLNWAWNQSIDLADENAFMTWEFDTDTERELPIDLTQDLYVLGEIQGPFGAVSGGDPTIAAGFSLFAPRHPGTGLTRNGSVGPDRVGRNACYFEENVSPLWLPSAFALAGPPDDDLNNGYCDSDPDTSCSLVCSEDWEVRCNDDAGCNGVCIDDFCSNAPAVACFVDEDCEFGTCTIDLDCATFCVFDNLDVDEYVRAHGPIRNMSLSAHGGPDMVTETLEDIYGPTGERFRGAIGLYTSESSREGVDAIGGYGLAIDDMVVEWREYTLGEDGTDCEASGSCAVIVLGQTTIFDLGRQLEILVLEESPSVNDCDGDGGRTGPGDDLDCDDNGVPDLVVEITSPAEPEGERIVLNRADGPGGFQYRGQIALSSSLDRTGVLFVRSGGDGTSSLWVRYEDVDDGTGSACADPWIEAHASIVFVDGEVTVTRVVLADNNDFDGWADDHETLQMFAEVSNKTGRELTNITLNLFTTSPGIECILTPTIHFGTLAMGETRLSSGAFHFVVGEVGRNGVSEDLTAEFLVNITASQLNSSTRPQRIELELDLDVNAGSGSTEFFEDFESGDLGNFTGVDLDATAGGSLAASGGYRCQYSDPFNPESNVFGTGAATTCYLHAAGTPNDFHWQVTADRASNGIHSAYFGIPLGGELGFTTPLAQLEAIQTIDPLNLGLDSPQLSFKHQISLMDWRTMDTGGQYSADRAVVQVQLADVPGADWVTIEPHHNVYDTQASDAMPHCTFDPVDDGSVETDVDDPSGRLGPSSTCYERHSFAYMGDTDQAFAAHRIGNASDGPGLPGSSGQGTWVESMFNLEPYRGRQIHLRFLETGHKQGIAGNYEELFHHNPDPGDDGWFIDEIRVTDLLVTPAGVVADTKDNGGLPNACYDPCSATAELESDAQNDVLPAPGQTVQLSAATSNVSGCVDGILEFRFWIDGDGNGLGGDAADELLRDWSDSPFHDDVPAATTPYVVEIRCSTDPDCTASAFLEIEVPVVLGCIVFQTIVAEDGDTLSWGGPVDYVYAKGDLSAVSNYQTTDVGAGGPSRMFDVSFDQPTAGQGVWYLMRNTCSGAGWTSGGGGELSGRDGVLP